MMWELARVIELLAAGLARSTRPEDRALVERYLAELAPTLARCLAGKDVTNELETFERLVSNSWLVDPEPFQGGLATWHSLFAARQGLEGSGSATSSVLSQILLLVEHAGTVPAEVRELAYTPETFGSWFVRLRCRGTSVRVVWDGREGVLRVERQRAGGVGDWNTQRSWASERHVWAESEVIAAIREAAD